MGETRADELNIRVIRKEDMDRVVALDARVTGEERREYYERKFAQVLGDVQHVATSLVAEQDGKILGFVMGDLYLGEFGIPETTATVDTIGVDPDIRRKGIATALMQELRGNMRTAGVERMITHVEWGSWDLIRFFHEHSFEPSRTVALELKL